MTNIDLIILYAMSVVTFIVYALDKRQAVVGGERTSEFALILMTFLGGGFGALCAMIFFNHKTKHRTFLYCVPLAVCIQVAIPIVTRVFMKG